MKKLILIPILLIFYFKYSQSQSTQWQLWATGLPQGAYPRMIVCPNHDLYYTLLGTPTKLGVIFKANTQNQSAGFSELPAVPRPTSVVNNIVCLGYNLYNELLAGIYRNNNTEPWLFYFDSKTLDWKTAQTDLQPSLGAQSIATDSKGNIFVTTRWAYIYKSIDHGRTFKAIDESKIIAEQYPCYYPSFLNQSTNNGSLFTINIDKRDRIYAGTETAGVIYSDDEGKSWHPADLFACLNDKNIYDTTSPMSILSRSGNVAAIGFTKENNIVWSGNDFWHYNWKNAMSFANMTDSTCAELKGIPDYLVQRGQQVSKIVTTDNGTMFFHSGSNASTTQVGIYRSVDGINWQLFNNGITGQNDGLSQGSLTVDGNKVFMSTHDGQIWMYNEEISSFSEKLNTKYEILPNPSNSIINLFNLPIGSNIKIYDVKGNLVFNVKSATNQFSMSMEGLENGIYFIKIGNETNYSVNKIIKH